MDAQSIDYHKIFMDLIQRVGELDRQRDEIDGEMAKVKQMILATFPLLTEGRQRMYQAEIDLMEEEQNPGLLEAIKAVFRAHKGEWLTPSTVRDYLIQMPFDFRQYKTNPLASISTTLKRMVPDKLEMKSPAVGGVFFRRRLTLLEQMARDKSSVTAK